MQQSTSHLALEEKSGEKKIHFTFGPRRKLGREVGREVGRDLAAAVLPEVLGCESLTIEQYKPSEIYSEVLY